MRGSNFSVFAIECNYRTRVVNAKDDGIESQLNRKKTEVIDLTQ